MPGTEPAESMVTTVTEETPLLAERGESSVTGYFIIDEGNPHVYTLYDDANNEIVIDEGTDLSQTILRFMENGWTLFGEPWTYVQLVKNGHDEVDASFHCQAVVHYD